MAKKKRAFMREMIQDLSVHSGISQKDAETSLEHVLSFLSWKLDQELPINLGFATLTPRRDAPRNINFNLKKNTVEHKIFLCPAKTRWVVKVNPKRQSHE